MEKNMETVSTDTGSTYLSVVASEDDSGSGCCGTGVKCSIKKGGTVGQVGKSGIKRKRWRERNEWRSNFVREVRAAVLRHEKLTRELKLEVTDRLKREGTKTNDWNGYGGREDEGKECDVRNQVGECGQDAGLVSLNGDGTEDLFSEDMVVIGTIDVTECGCGEELRYDFVDEMYGRDENGLMCSSKRVERLSRMDIEGFIWEDMTENSKVEKTEKTKS